LIHIHDRPKGIGRGPLNLVKAPHNTPLRIVELSGGESVRRRLMALGFHKGEIVELDGRAIFRGPLLVRNCTSDTTIALGRGVALKVHVELVHERS
jgi:Fe2+ transport system protein FeoA